MDGIAAMPIINNKCTSAETGKPMGRPPVNVPNFEKILKKQKDGLNTAVKLLVNWILIELHGII